MNIVIFFLLLIGLFVLIYQLSKISDRMFEKKQKRFVIMEIFISMLWLLIFFLLFNTFQPILPISIINI